MCRTRFSSSGDRVPEGSIVPSAVRGWQVAMTASLARISRPSASRTPVARPPETTISTTALPVRISPPRVRSRRASASGMACMPPTPRVAPPWRTMARNRCVTEVPAASIGLAPAHRQYSRDLVTGCSNRCSMLSSPEAIRNSANRRSSLRLRNAPLASDRSPSNPGRAGFIRMNGSATSDNASRNRAYSR